MHCALIDRRPARNARVIAVLCLTVGLLPYAPLTEVAHAGGAGPAMLRPDFNGDGFDDLAIGEPFATVDGEQAAGRVLVLYGSSEGLESAGAQTWTQDSEQMADDPQASDTFGHALASGDFDDDGFADLAVGVPGEDIGLEPNVLVDKGMVQIIYGSPNGLRPTTEFLTGVQEFERFGHALAALDAFAFTELSPDGFADLAIGSPGFDLSSGESDHGRVRVRTGSEQGLVGDNTDFEDIGGPHDGAEMGASLAAGDFGNGIDLAMGAPGATVGGLDDAGAVYSMSLAEISPNTSEIQGTSEADDRWGTSLAAGDFDGDGHDDLAVGAPYEDLDGGADAGLVNVIYGSTAGLTAHNNELLLQQPGVLDPPEQDEEDDFFGLAIETGDFGRGPQEDLAIGVPGENSRRGLVHLLYGSPGGLGIHSAQNWTQGTPGVLGQPQDDDLFGISLGAGRFGKAGRADLAIGVPRESAGGNLDAGAVSVLYSKKTGLSSDADQLWHRDSPGVPGSAATGFFLGHVLYSSADPPSL